MRHNLKSIAELAGVSTATVSLALRGDSRVAEKTRGRIAALAAEMDYVPSNLGRALQADRSSLVGFMISTMSHSYYNEILEGFCASASARGYGVLVSMPASGYEEHAEAFRLFLEKRVDGVVLATHHPDMLPDIQKTRSAGIPVVFVCSGLGAEAAPLIKNDDVATGRVAAEHLLKLGHSEIAYCYAATVAHQRFSGALEACMDAGARCRRFTDQSAFLAAMRLPERPTAVVAYSDNVAFTVIEALRKMGLSVPADVSVVGVDDSPSAALPAYNLTTVAPKKREIGALALDSVLRELDGCDISSVFLKPEMVVRKSTIRNVF